jgi:cyanate permease
MREPVTRANCGIIGIGSFLIAFISSLVPLWMSFPLLSLLLKARGVGDDVIGVFSAMPWIGLTIVSPLVPTFIHRLGLHRALAVGILAGSLALLLFWTTNSLLLWFAINFMQGVALAIRWAAADTWINAAVSESKRGHITGIYDMLTGGAVGLGPTLLIFLGTSSLNPLLYGAAIGAAGLVPLCLAWKSAPTITEAGDQPHGSIWRIPRVEPAAFLALVLAGFAEATSLSFLPLYGLSHGLSEQTATVLLSVTQGGVLIGSMLFGLMADRIKRMSLLFWAVAISAAIPGILPIVISHSFQWPVLFTWGIGQGGAFVVGMIILGSRFASSGLAQAMTVAMMAYTVGGLVGPSSVGLVVSMFGVNGQPLTLATCGAIVLVALLCVKGLSRSTSVRSCPRGSTTGAVPASHKLSPAKSP